MAFAIVAACTTIGALVGKHLQLADLVMINLLGVVFVSLRFGIGPSLFTAVLGVLSSDFFFLPPLHDLSMAEPHHWLTFAGMIAVAGAISLANEKVRRNERDIEPSDENARRMQAQLETERLRSSLLSAVSHDLKTPLTTIVGTGQLLAERDPAMSEGKRVALASTIVEESERLRALISNLLAMTRLENGTIEVRRDHEAVDVVIASALRRLRPRLGARPIRTDVPAEIPLVFMDPILIEQVVINLLENAMKYTPAESSIEVRAQPTDGSVAISVADRGPGIRPDELGKVFERFQRGTAAARGDGGVGLGLAICRAVVAAHGGRIDAHNREGGGAVVEFTLPIGRGDA